MSAYQRLRWKRVLNDCKHAQQELELVQGLNREAAPMFQEYYEKFLMENDLDLNDLNRQHADKIREAYDIPEAVEIDGSVPVEADDASLIVDVENRDKTEEEQLTEDDIVLHGIFAKLFKKIARDFALLEDVKQTLETINAFMLHLKRTNPELEKELNQHLEVGSENAILKAIEYKENLNLARSKRQKYRDVTDER